MKYQIISLFPSLDLHPSTKWRFAMTGNSGEPIAGCWRLCCRTKARKKKQAAAPRWHRSGLTLIGYSTQQKAALMSILLKQFIRRHPIVMLASLLVLAGASVFLVWRSLDARSPLAPVVETPSPNNDAPSQGGNTGMEEEPAIVSIRLSPGQAQPQAAQLLQVATGEPLPGEAIQQILARLPAFSVQDGDQTDFKLPQDPIPPPRPGQTVQESFPPPPAAVSVDVPASGPLEVLRYAPEGEIPIAPFVQVTFNQPMIPLATIETLAAMDVPVQIDPPLEGTWRWLGTKTLTFEYDSALIDRLPKATVYSVRVPAGTKSQTGGALAETVEWTFSTPPPVVSFTFPNDYEPQPRDPLFVVGFDQRIDPDAVLKTIQVTANNRPVQIKRIAEVDVLADPKHKSVLNNVLEGRRVAFQAVELLPENASISVTIGPGTPSAEGPLTSPTPHSYSFRTFAPLKVVEHGCSWGDDPCRPLTPLYIRFNNPLVTPEDPAAVVRVDPEILGANINIYGDTITIQGATKGQTTYTVTVSRELQDTFGQTLGKDTRLTFRIGKADPLLAGPGETFITLDPASKKPIFSVYSLNYSKLDVQVYAVQPSDWPAFKQYLRDVRRTDVKVTVPGRKVRDRSLPVEAATDTLTEVGIDLSGEMDGPSGQFIVVVAPPSGLFVDQRQREWQTVRVWVQITGIGLDALNDHSEMVAWATNLKDGAPLSGVTIEAGGAQAGITGQDGVARFTIPAVPYLTARLGADLAMLPYSTYSWGDEGWSQRSVRDSLRWYVFDDRQMYRPGEEVHVKGWMRLIGGKQSGDIGLVGEGVTAVSYQLIDPQGNEIGAGRKEVNALGGFDFVFSVPEAVNLGTAQLILNAEGSLPNTDGLQFYHTIQVQEFRTPEFEVTARNETTGPYFTGEHGIVAVDAKYYAGDPLPNAEVTWQVRTSPGHYDPPNWPDFTFGTWTPWWWYSGPVYVETAFGYPGPAGASQIETFTGLTDASGTHFLRLDFDSIGEPQPLSVLAEATVMDVNRQAWASATTLLVHPANLYVGMRSQRYFVERGTPLEIELIVTDLDGNPVADRPVKVQAARLEWKYNGTSWEEVEADVQDCTVGSQVDPVACTFQTATGGEYRITATVADEMSRLNKSQITRWVSGGKRPIARKVEQEEATLIPDKETYQPGDMALILVQSPFSPAEGLLTVSRSGILYTERFRIEQDTITLEIPIEDAHTPNLNIQVDLTGAAARTDDQGTPLPDVPARPAYAKGTLNLKIPPVLRTLSLEVTPLDKELEPGGETTLDLTLTGASGEPVEGAELAVVVVDEAILALTNYQMADPLAVFYSERSADLSAVYSRAFIRLIDPLALAGQANDAMREAESKQMLDMAAGAPMEAPAAAMPTMTAEAAREEGGAAQPEAIKVRSNFNPLAVFSPAVRTGADGKAQISVKLPDNLTRYRVMVVAVDNGKRFGMGESSITARLPLMARPSAPRFLNFGDHFELPVVVQNSTDEPLDVDVVLQVANLELTGPAGVRVTVPPRDRLEVRFPVTTQTAGTARFQVAAVAGQFADAATIELPVYTPATTEAFATYGVVDEGAILQLVSAPQGVFPQYGGLEITTSSTALQALTDAVLYLVAYPYDCTEQIASRVLGIAALRDVLTAFQAEGLPPASDLETAVERDMQTLSGLQNYDGGFPYWRHGNDSIPFNTIHVAHAMARAEQKGFSVPAGMRSQALEYLRNIESHYPAWYSQHTRQVLSSYAVYVRNLFGDRDPQKALKIYNDAGLENLPLDAVGWLWPTLQDYPAADSALEAIRRHIGNRTVETAGAANFITDFDEQNYLLLGSNRRTDAILLDTLILDNPQHDLIPKLVNGLLAHRKQGRWGNTQENVFVLLALDRYFNTFEAQTPEFVARLWLGETYAGEHTFSGRTTERSQTNIPMSYLVDPALGGGQDQNLVLSKDGVGRMYYRLGLRYAPTDLQLDPLDMGFVVTRSYEAVDNPEDVRQDETGAWHIKAGARVRVRLTMVASDRRYHVALSDPLPAGLEIVNPELAVSGSTPQDPSNPSYKYGWWWWGTWYEHQNLRDERAEAFTSLLWDGVYNYSYVARATTPGTYVVPPARAEEMYSPEVFGRSSSDQVIVE